jgi:hypothetical protein
MATRRQTNANRENAKRSTGPKTAEGKAKVRYNAMQHGLLAEAALLPDEDEATFRSFSKKIAEELAPVGEMESLLVEQVINTLWRLRRLSQVEAGLFVRESAAQAEEHHRAQAQALEVSVEEWLCEQSVLTSRQPIRILNEDQHQDALAGAAAAAALQQTELARLGGTFARDAQGGDTFSKLARYETTLRRALERALRASRILEPVAPRADRPFPRGTRLPARRATAQSAQACATDRHQPVSPVTRPTGKRSCATQRAAHPERRTSTRSS